MKMNFKFILSLLIILTATAFISSEKKPAGKKNVKLEFVHMVGNIPLKLKSETYTNALGQPYTIQAFKYYISNVKLRYKNGSYVKDPGYFLVDHEMSSSTKIDLYPDADEFIELEFILGIDSARNCSGVQEDELDPSYGMFWTWNTGYIFLKLDGTAEASTAPKHMLEYHIGGYKEPANCIRKIRIPLTTGKLVSQIKLKVNIDEIFSGPLTVDFAKMPVVNDYNHAVEMADNYSDMFSVMEVK